MSKYSIRVPLNRYQGAPEQRVCSKCNKSYEYPTEGINIYCAACWGYCLTCGEQFNYQGKCWNCDYVQEGEDE